MSSGSPVKTPLPEFDKYHYYRRSVQNPYEEALFLDWLYRDARGGTAPATLREDFCGTFSNCCSWVRLDPERRAVGVDLDSEPLEYGCTHYYPLLKLKQQARVELLQENVLTSGLPKADVICALNFSYFIFKQRSELLAYFRNCYQTLEPDGIFVLDCFGGPADQKSHEMSNYEEEGYTYYFEQEGFDPLTNEAIFYIHFRRKGEEKRLKVFTYDWRVWAMPELRDALLEVGFDSVRIYWEGRSPDGESEFDFHRIEHVSKEPDTWWTYVVALR